MLKCVPGLLLTPPILVIIISADTITHLILTTISQANIVIIPILGMEN